MSMLRPTPPVAEVVETVVAAGIGQGLGVIWLKLKSLVVSRHRILVFPHPMGDHTKQMQGDGLFGVGLQNLLISILGPGQATRDMGRQSEV